MKTVLKKIFVPIVLLLFILNVQGKATVEELGEDWSRANYALIDEAQEAAFKDLILEADEYIESNSTDAKGWIWRGIIKSSYAGVKGGLGALSLAKQAKSDFVKALSIDEYSLSGSAHASLGTLYAKVPGWPFGFGSDKKASEHLLKSLEINPLGVDPNFFYGEFLYSEKRNYIKAKEYLLRAQDGKKVNISLLADDARQKEIKVLLIKVQKKLERKNR